MFCSTSSIAWAHSLEGQGVGELVEKTSTHVWDGKKMWLLGVVVNL